MRVFRLENNENRGKEFWQQASTANKLFFSQNIGWRYDVCCVFVVRLLGINQFTNTNHAQFMHSKHQTMNTSSDNTTPEQAIASDSDQTWSQESDIRSLRAAEFEVIDESSTEDEDGMIVLSQKKKGGRRNDDDRKKQNSYNWKFLCDPNEKHTILTNRFTKFTWDFTVSTGCVCRCKFHLDCQFRIKIVAPNSCK